MKYAQDFIDKVREASNLVDIIGQYVQLRRAGVNHQGLCPFHNEKSPSFSVHEDKQVYHCFGCKASGNVYTFVQQYQGLTFPEAVEYLARRAGISIPENKFEPAAAKDIKHSLFKVNALAAQYYHQKLLQLPPDHEVRHYLAKRRLDDELVKTYRLGYAPDAWSELAAHLQQMRAPISAAETLGLVRARGGGKSGHYDMFRHRLMFPIFSTTKQCVGFGGRVLSAEQSPKYLNSVDSPVFHKGKVFYGLDHAIKFIREADEVIVVEGYMDWLALARVGIHNIVATLGTALTSDHARLLQRYTERVVLLFDGDNAGREAARRSLPILLHEGLLVRGLFLPDQLDPDEFIEERGDTQLRNLIERAPDLFDLISVERWSQAKGSPSAKVQLMDEFAPVLAAAQDPRLKRLYAGNLANLLSVDVRLVEQSVAKPSGAGLAPGSRSVAVAAPKRTSDTRPLPGQDPDKIDLSKLPRVELELLNVILLKEVYLKEALAAKIGPQLSHAGARDVVLRIAEVYGQMPSKFDSLSALLANEVKPVEMITRHLNEPYTSLSDENAHKLLQDCIKRVKENFLRLKSKELVSGLRAGSPMNSSEQLEQIMNVQKSRQSLKRDS